MPKDIFQTIPTDIMPGGEGSQFNPANAAVPGNKSLGSSSIAAMTPLYNAITGSVVYLNSSGVYAQDSGINYSETLKLLTVGGLSLLGSSGLSGTAVLVAGVKVVSAPKVTAKSIIILTPQNLGAVLVPTMVGVTARTAGTSFTITSANAIDTSKIGWVIIEPG